MNNQNKNNYNHLSSTAYGFNYCWMQDGEVYRDKYLSMDDFSSYVLWHWGNAM